MTRAKIGDTVRVHYMGKLDDGTVFDTTMTHEPVEFTIGSRQVIPGFEQAVIGLEPGESVTVRVPALKAFGAYRPEMVQSVHPSQLPDGMEPEVGQQLQIPRSDGQPFLVRVTEVSDASITLDANHPLAGQDLTFNVRLVEIKEAQEE
ncbi:MAG: peptidylprolyl isomerase [Anaerolineae bacterium]|nr:peptidylprolyl isomerase [Anaerolineae bacterium]MDX9833236.1 peptidylprolyl isomerase [Anaerolineae bacterium]